jgi:hypothetical protein
MVWDLEIIENTRPILVLVGTKLKYSQLLLVVKNT